MGELGNYDVVQTHGENVLMDEIRLVEMVINARVSESVPRKRKRERERLPYCWMDGLKNASIDRGFSVGKA